MNYAAYILLCYLAGALPTGYLFGKILRGIDIREHGSGKMGATNVFRTLGKGPGLAVLAVDIAKGAAAVALFPLLLNTEGGWLLAGAVTAVLGHNFTVFLNFRGGKGVATTAGVMLGLAPAAMATDFAVFACVLLLSRMISVSSLAAATALPALVWVYAESGAYHGVFYLALLLSLFVWLRHRDNIRRILSGTENRFNWSSGKK
jgi:glycerol-3-phosphate acyltransferase PlsY